MIFLKLLKIHFIYLFSKRNILILCLFTFVISLVNIIIITKSQTIAESSIVIIQNTWETVFTFNKLLLILLSTFLMNNFCLPMNDEYRVLFMVDLERKEIYFLTKILVLILVITSVCFVVFLIFILFFLILNIDFKLDFSIIKGLLLIYFQLLVYGLLSSNFAIIINSTLSSILSFIIYLIMDLFNQENSILNTFFPLIVFDKYEIFFENYLLNLLVISIFYIIIYILILRGKNY